MKTNCPECGRMDILVQRDGKTSCPSCWAARKRNHVEEFLRESNAIEGVYSDFMLEDAISAWDYMDRQVTITPDIVREVHRILMRRSDLKKNEIGKFRKVPVYVGGRECMKAEHIELAIREWCKDMAGYNDLDPRLLHVRYERIHPFVDGNGRTGRIFYNWLLVRREEPIHVIYESEKHDYYKWFNHYE